MQTVMRANFLFIALSFILQGVKIENFTTSWANGVAFCALIHYFFPQSFDFQKIDGANRRKNYELAFKTGE